MSAIDLESECDRTISGPRFYRIFCVFLNTQPYKNLQSASQIICSKERLFIINFDLITVFLKSFSSSRIQRHYYDNYLSQFLILSAFITVMYL